MAKVTYTPEEMQEAIRYAADLLQHVPTIQEYEDIREKEMMAFADESPENLERIAKDPHWMPSHVTIRAKYGNWTNATQEIRKTFPNKFRRENISFLQDLIQKKGSSVTEREYEEYRKTQAPDAPVSASLIKGFGSWTKALEAAGSSPSHYRYWKDEDLIGMVVTLGVELGRLPSVSEYDRIAKMRKWPASRQLYRRFNSWENIKQLSAQRFEEELSKPGAKQKAETIALLMRQSDRARCDLSALRELAEELGRTPKIGEYNFARQGKSWPSAETIRKQHGSWKQACRAAGLQAVDEPEEVTA